VRLLVKYIRGGVVSAIPELGEKPKDPDAPADDDVLAFAY
jgi:cytochrome d ubiquinol oxidase subunit I